MTIRNLKGLSCLILGLGIDKLDPSYDIQQHTQNLSNAFVFSVVMR